MTYGQWELKMMALRGKPKWRQALAMPGLWLRHFGSAVGYVGVLEAARLATLYVRVMLVKGIS